MFDTRLSLISLQLAWLTATASWLRCSWRGDGTGQAGFAVAALLAAGLLGLLRRAPARTYGIWIKDPGGWLGDADNMIFWTTSEAVARAQLAQIDPSLGRRGAEVRAFEDTTSPV